MNIAVGGFFHESNTFNPIITGMDDFIIFEKDEIYNSGNAYLLAKGIIDYYAEKPEYKVIPLVFARAVPNGEVDEMLYCHLKSWFFQCLEEAPPIDAFVLALHGSMRVKHIGSAESDLLVAIKSRYPETPVFCGLDMHATVTRAMLECADALVGFKTAPHTDAYETGWQAAMLADVSLSTNTKLCMGSARMDTLIAGEKSETDCEPMKTLISELHKMEAEDDVLTASYLLGFPWADAEENGVTALVVTKANQSKAKQYAKLLTDKFIQHKNEFCFSSPAFPAEEALAMALKETSKPVFVSDSGDNPTAGSTADNTAVLSLLSNELKDLTRDKKILVAGVFDPEAVITCRESMNQQVTLMIGGRFDTIYCQPVELTGTPVSHAESFGNYKSDLVLLKTEYFDLILSSRHIGFTDVEMFKALNIDYMDFDVIVVKLGYLTPDFQAITAKSYLALTKGCTDEILSRLTYHKQYELL